MKEPLVSVIIPFYSNKEWLAEAINSVIEQTYNHVEILVINDGSPESLNDIAEKYEKKIKVFNKDNGGPSSARNLGIKLSNGKYIAFLDSDDLWLPDKLYRQITFMEENDYIWSQHSYEMFWEDNSKTKIIDTSKYSGYIYLDCFISLKIQTSCVVVLKKEIVDMNIKFPLKERYGQDLSFFRQIAKKHEIGYVNGVYSKFRIRGKNAGFQAKIQIGHKASVWKKLKLDNYLLNKLPKPIIYAYKYLSSCNDFIDFIDKRIANKEMIEIISKFLYLFPYFIYKFYARKRYVLSIDLDVDR